MYLIHWRASLFLKVDILLKGFIGFLKKKLLVICNQQCWLKWLNRNCNSCASYLIFILFNKYSVKIAKIAYKNQNGWVRIGEESLWVLFQTRITLQSNRKSLWNDIYTKYQITNPLMKKTVHWDRRKITPLLIFIYTEE
jgi:hypothetical protein